MSGRKFEGSHWSGDAAVQRNVKPPGPPVSMSPLPLSTTRHDLMTPVTSIRAFVEILMQDPDIDFARRQQFLGIVLQESERLTDCIDALLEQSDALP